MLLQKIFRICPSKHLSKNIEARWVSTSLFTMDNEKKAKGREKNELRRRNTKGVPGTVTLQVLGSGANGSPTAVYLFTDQSRYLFNCGEGTQRLAHEHKTKLSRLEQIFVTRNTWSMMGGLPGLVLTVQDAGVKNVGLHGPPELDNILHSMKRFVILKNLQVTTLDCTESRNRIFEDQVMTVECVPIYKNRNQNSGLVAITEKPNVVIVYICKLKPKQGTLNLEKCVEKGVPPGPLLGMLKNGIDVTLDNGIVVKSADVSEVAEKELSFMFVDIPDEQFLESFQDKDTGLQSVDTDYENMTYVIHFTPENIIKKHPYVSFVQSFHKKTKHIFLNQSNSFSGYVSTHRIQYQLNQINPILFPILGESDCMTNSNFSKKSKLIEHEVDSEKSPGVLPKFYNNDSKIGNIQSLTNFHIRPKKGLDRTSEAKLNASEFIKEVHAIEGFQEIVEQLKTELNEKQTTTGVAASILFPKIIFLGTGSCIPNKTRNVSAILVQTNENSFILLDCGEGTLGQIIRFFGERLAVDVLRNLKAIYVSHLHADHHIGLIGILNQRQQICGSDLQPLFLFAPKQMQPWLNFYNDSIENIKMGYQFIPNGELIEQPFVIPKDSNSGLHSLSTCLVKHCAHSFGVSFTLDQTAQTHIGEEPIKITYSGDTMPCNDLIDLGRNSTILIHEATMEDDLVEEARIKMHSTLSEAINQGNQMNAQYIILTHFSQRYAKLPRMNIEKINNVAIAFDNMRITLDDLKNFHSLYPALKSMFADHCEELEQKAMKREFKLERKRKLLSV